MNARKRLLGPLLCAGFMGLTRIGSAGNLGMFAMDDTMDAAPLLNSGYHYDSKINWVDKAGKPIEQQVLARLYGQSLRKEAEELEGQLNNEKYDQRIIKNMLKDLKHEIGEVESGTYTIEITKPGGHSLFKIHGVVGVFLKRNKKLSKPGPIFDQLQREKEKSGLAK